MEVLYGSKVILRPITMEDTPLIVKWRNTESVRKNFIFREKFTSEMHTKWMQTKVAFGEVVQYIIIDRASSMPVGSVYFRDVNRRNHSAEFGIFIGEEASRGKGLGTETARLFTAFGFKSLGLHKIILRVLTENKQAEKSYLNAGFKVEGVFHDMEYIDGKYVDVQFMSMTRPRRYDGYL